MKAKAGWRPSLPGLEATYEESKQGRTRPPPPHPKGLEATYEESKRRFGGHFRPAHQKVWKLPMGNPSFLKWDGGGVMFYLFGSYL